MVYYVNEPDAKLVANLDGEGKFADTDDACFQTLIQAIILYLQGRWVLTPYVEEAYRRFGETPVCGAHLWAACERMDYYRCRERYLVDTSNDMLIPAHYLAALTGGKLGAPRFGGRKMKWRNALLGLSFTGGVMVGAAGAPVRTRQLLQKQPSPYARGDYV
jgi:hypothetical protein